MIDMMDVKYKDGLVPAIAQDFETGEILMLAYMNEEALIKTVETGVAHYWSRSRSKIWRKGETSGNEQSVKDILVDCDEDAVLLKVKQIGGACHTGYRSCFYRRLDGEIVGEKLFDPEDVY
ncbi:MAG: phosphoribosyl-AMP cyclohydrolase [Halobacteriota archaeon]|nr:phosphoribosyl-AMP cyclohydrolase [Halobacteriota archaeon]